ncbi:HutD/Ves family protein [Bosea sp. PAMC 26642]|uniref:HutD/Ves family protein n=1 Tax=Bosea sp. (strain PAMC 26642) TaxID=1792307 RepID=UPI0009E7586D|nr:HutD family protein [Bosea sp. PAMC 26642]
MPWKNGGGSTTEIAIHPPGASLDEFDWRISTAHVGQDGPFSSFPGIDRTLAVLSGMGIALAFGDGGTVQLSPNSKPCAFAGDRAVEGRLVAGPIDDLNVMTRRGRWRHDMTRLAGPGPIHVEPGGDLMVLVARSAGWMIVAGRKREYLEAGDSVVLERSDHAVLTSEGDGEVFATNLWTDGSR